MSKDLEFEKNSDSNKLLLSDLKRIKDEIFLGGGKKNIEKQTGYNGYRVYAIPATNQSREVRIKIEDKISITKMVCNYLAHYYNQVEKILPL